MAQQSTFLEELMAAGRGVFALLVADRKASRFFDFSRRGLAGSFIALTLGLLLSAVLPTLLGDDSAIFERAVAFVALQVLQIGFSAVVLRQSGRMDSFVPYLVTDNWTGFFLQLIGSALAAAGGDAMTFVVLIVAIYLEVNIARLIVGLTPLQTAMLLIAQVVALLLSGLLIAFVLFPEQGQLILQQLAAQ